VFWAGVLGYPPPDIEGTHAVLRALGQAEDELGNWYRIEDPAGQGPKLAFQRVPEPKVTKNRLHLDVSLSKTGRLPGTPRRNDSWVLAPRNCGR
jgi:glyoxalase superfamily protein